ncbi:MAG: undecaprenyldiphospho-muramoylpentapeptide beta-N-acetylglucosaminyltransferase [Spirochaetaceae bacterium]|jgi:UDP-N-acetylglucosamine--N-acetylmuramyl-(pentapeptide) pyrophosphoryl-undecaprenol N-acetylglucosamine transferase|nr:undecaprenyldiphospho-muramoylpentapeptide beta-N-acetylglucosaminyltransferase [Spirochaetaceae bacterium]
MITIAFAGGGTGGHIYPGLAVIANLKKILPCRVFWIGANTGMDRAIVEDAGIEFYGIPAGKLRRYFSLRNIADIFRVLAGFFAARKILKREKPALLFSKGGFVSVPPCAAASTLRIPVFTHESDFSPGLATRINLRFTEKAFTAFRETAGLLPPAVRGRAVYTGNPIRPEFRAASAESGRAFLGINGEDPVLLVLGASLGARQINELVRECLPRLTGRFVVVHQTGPGAAWDIPASGRYKPYPFIRSEMPHVIAASTLVLCRGGAGTIWECASLGKPMILIPLAGSGTRGDQVENARYLEGKGAALVLRGDVKAGDVAAAVERLAEDEGARAKMAAAALEFAALDGGRLIAEAIAAYPGLDREESSP